MPDNWRTKLIPFAGGLVLNQPDIQQGIESPGSAIQGVNYEPHPTGGYKRLAGYVPWDPNPVPGTGPVLGVTVFNLGVVAARGDKLAYSEGHGWTQFQPSPRTGAKAVKFTRYNWVTPTIITVDGVNKPLKWDGTTATVLSAAPAGASCVTEHKNHIFLGVGSILTFGAPGSDTDFSAVSGAGQVQVGSEIVALASWRDQLFVFCRRGIFKLVGTSFSDFQIQPVTKKMGCVSGATVQEIGGDLVYLAVDGIRTISGTDRIGDVELGAVSRPIHQRVLDLLGDIGAATFSSCIVRAKSQYRLLVSHPSTTRELAQGVLGGLRDGQQGLAWEWFDTLGIRATCADSEYLPGGEELVVHGDHDGMVFQDEVGSSFNGAAVQAVMQMAWQPFDDPAVRKTLFQARLNFEAGGPTDITLSTLYDLGLPLIQPQPYRLLLTDGGVLNYDSPSARYDDSPEDKYDSTGHQLVTIPLQGSGFNSSFTFWSEDTNPPHTLKSITIEYALGGRV